MTPADTPSDPGVSRLYQTHPSAEPPAALDAAILAAARQALVPPRRPWWQRLQIPVAVAATGMLAVMLTLTMQRNPQKNDYPPASAPETAPAAPTNPASLPPAAREQAESKPATTAAPRRQPHAPAKEAHSDRAPAAKAEAVPPATPATASAYIAPPAKLAAPPQEAPAAAAAPSPAPGLADTAARNEPTRSAESMEKRAPATPAAAAPAPQQLRARAIARSPDDWLAEIRKLREQGQQEAAAREWEAFRKAYPDIPLPEDLRQRP